MNRWALCIATLLCACSGDGAEVSAGAGGASGSIGGDGDGDMLPGDCSDHPLELVPSERYVFAIDGSSSMNMPMGTASAQTRWHALREALFGADGVVTARASTTALGLAIYGTAPTCPLPLDLIEPALDNAAAMQAGYPESAPGTSSPMGPALTEFATRLWQGAASTMLVVITASAPTSCTDDAVDWTATYGPANDLAFTGFRLRFVSVDAQLPSAELQKLANVGARLDVSEERMPAPFVQATTSAELRDGIAASMDAYAACTFEFNAAVRPQRLHEGTVTINGTAIPLSIDGWMPSTPSRIVFQGASCESLQADPAAVVAASFPCDAYERLPGE